MKLTNEEDSPVSREGWRSWLNGNVLGISLTSLFSDMSHEMATAILPFFIIFDLGGTAAIVGLVEGVSDGASSAVKSYAGYFSDKKGRRTPVMYLGYALTGVLIPAIGFCTSWLEVLVLRAGAWMGRGARGPPRDALLTESVPARSVGKAFGFQRAMDTAGAVIGPAIALVLIPYVRYSAIFFVSLVPGVVSVIAVVALVREVRTTKATKVAGFRSSLAGLPRSFKLYLAGVGLFGIANFSNVIFTLRAEEVLQPSLGPLRSSEYAVLLYVILNVFYALASFPVGHLADRMPKRRLLAAGYVIFALACVESTSESPFLPTLALIFVLAGLQAAIIDTVEGAYAADLIGGAQKGSGFGALQTVNGLGDLVSSVLIGIMLTYSTPELGFSLTAAIAVAGAVVLLAFTRRASLATRTQPHPHSVTNVTLISSYNEKGMQERNVSCSSGRTNEHLGSHGRDKGRGQAYHHGQDDGFVPW